MAPRYISNTLCERYNDPYQCCPLEIVDLERMAQTEDHASAFNNMYHWLRRLVEGKCSPGALAIGRIQLFNWKEFFDQDPLYEQVNWLLETSGMGQMSWIAPKSMLGYMTSPLTLLTTKMQELTFNDTDQPQEDLIGRRIELVEKIKKRTEVAEEHLRSSLVTELAESLRIAGVIAYYGEFIKAFEKDGYILKDGDEGLSTDVFLCQKYLGELDGWLEGRVADLEHDGGLENIVTITGGWRRRRRKLVRQVASES